MGNGITVTLAIIAALLGVYALLLFTSPLPFSVIDRDQSGFISFGEALDAIDVGQRNSEHDPHCVEYFWLKDGLPAYKRYNH